MEEQTYTGLPEYFDDSNPLDEGDEDGDHRKISNKRKRRQATTRPSSSSSPHVPLDLTISGVKCILHRNDSAAMQIEEGKHLIDYFDRQEEAVCDNDSDHIAKCHITDDWKDIIHNSNGNDSTEGGRGFRESRLNEEKDLNGCEASRPVLLMDRFDARALLDISEFEEQYTFSAKDVQCNHRDDDISDEEKNLLEKERYGDLEAIGTKLDSEEHDESKKTSKNSSENLHQNRKECNGIPTSEKAVLNMNDFKLDDEDRKKLPDEVQIPGSQRQFHIIEMAAKKSRELPQFEILLKVKQQNNTDFSFLNPNDNLYSFYQWIKDGKPTLRANNKEFLQESSCHNNYKAIGALAMYASSSGSDEEDEKESEAAKEGSDSRNTETFAMIGAEGVHSSSHSSEMGAIENDKSSPDKSDSIWTDEKKAQRLKKAKMLRQHFMTGNKE